jgi:hypothetical protein
MVLVAVVDAGQHLFHQDGGVFLCEFSSGNNLVKELTSLADPKLK